MTALIISDKIFLHCYRFGRRFLINTSAFQRSSLLAWPIFEYRRYSASHSYRYHAYCFPCQPRFIMLITTFSLLPPMIPGYYRHCLSHYNAMHTPFRHHVPPISLPRRSLVSIGGDNLRLREGHLIRYARFSLHNTVFVATAHDGRFFDDVALSSLRYDDCNADEARH